MERDAAREFLDRSLAFVRGGARRGSRPACATATELAPLTRRVDEAVGPFPAFTHELAASVRAHLAELLTHSDAGWTHGSCQSVRRRVDPVNDAAHPPS